MNITQQDIQKARPSKAGRWPEEPALQPLHRKQRPVEKARARPRPQSKSRQDPGPGIPGRAHPSCCPSSAVLVPQ